MAYKLLILVLTLLQLRVVFTLFLKYVTIVASFYDDLFFFFKNLDSKRLDAAKFAPFWNEIVKNLREEDYLTNL